MLVVQHGALVRERDVDAVGGFCDCNVRGEVPAQGVAAGETWWRGGRQIERRGRGTLLGGVDGIRRCYLRG